MCGESLYIYVEHIVHANVIVPQRPQECTPRSRPVYGERDLPAAPPRRACWPGPQEGGGNVKKC